MKSQLPRASGSSSPPNAQYSLRNKIHLLAMGCKYKTALAAFLCIQFGNAAEKSVAKAVL
jgi:hypothetical protein